MNILLVGEYSRLHNSLKAGLQHLGHEVTLVSSGDGFKKFSSDYSFESKVSNFKFVNFCRQFIYKLFHFDFATLERGIRFHLLLKHFKNYDIVQLINEQPIKTIQSYELYLLKRLVENNNKTFLLSCGVDYKNVEYLFGSNFRYSILNPYLENPDNKKHYEYVLNYRTKKSAEINEFLYDNVAGVIASDIDYIFALENQSKFCGLIPNPVDLSSLDFLLPKVSEKIIIFLGINRWNYIQKGIEHFENALKIIQKKYAEKVEIVITENLPYAEYIKIYNKAHILLDQVYAYDQGYNALEAMAQGKVVFTGAEAEFTEYYKLTDRVAVNALPDAEAIAKEIEYLIHNPEEIVAIGKRARDFVVKEHNYIKVANMYLDVWNKKSHE